MRRCFGALLLAALASAALTTARAASPAEAEISHLLDYLSASPCVFIRNGEASTAPDARAHIERKYQHVGKLVTTAEDFIAYAATRSSVSGQPYRVRCGEREFPSAAWLKEELARYRGETAAPKTP